MRIPRLAEGTVVWAAVWYHVAELITVAISPLAVVICAKAAEGLGLGAAAWLLTWLLVGSHRAWAQQEEKELPHD